MRKTIMTIRGTGVIWTVRLRGSTWRCPQPGVRLTRPNSTCAVQALGVFLRQDTEASHVHIVSEIGQSPKYPAQTCRMLLNYRRQAWQSKPPLTYNPDSALICVDTLWHGP